VSASRQRGFVAVLAILLGAISLFSSGVPGTGAYLTDSRAGSIGGFSVVPAPTPTPTPAPACVQALASILSHALSIQGSIATGSVTVAACTGLVISLVSYEAPAATFSEQTASQQVVFDSKTLTLDGGPHQLQVNVPSCYFQVDLVGGPVIQQLGPAGSGNFYGAQQRLLDSINGGTHSCVGTTPPPCLQALSSIVSHALSVQGTIATGNVTVSTCTGLVVSLVSYKAPSATFSEQTASQQVVFASKTLTLDAGAHQLQVNVPRCYYQVDLVVGTVIVHLGPAGSGNFYGAQGRLLDSINGGTRACGGGTRH